METPVLIAIITGCAGLLTAVLTTFWTFLQSRKITNLKSELELKNDKDSQTFKFLLSYETDMINQYFIHLKEFLILSQFVKDQIREIIKEYDYSFKEELVDRLKVVKTQIINQFSKSIYYFNHADQHRHAHSIKSNLVIIIDMIIDADVIDNKLLVQKINNVTRMQVQLQEEVDSEIDKIISNVRNRKEL
jgi:hypothetical protein